MDLIKFDPRVKDHSVKKCACGCGKTIAAFNRNGELFYAPGHHWRGKKRINENRNQKGSLNNNYKGGRIIDGYGYIQICSPGHPKATKRGNYVREHILVMERNLGRYLIKGERVHHINGDKQDNRIENLKLMIHGEHSRHHRELELKSGKPLFGRDK